jgi:hypothetical protein
MLYEIKETLIYFVEANSEDEAQELYNSFDKANANRHYVDIEVAK